MIAPLGSVVDVGALLETALASLVAGVGLTISFSLAILGSARFAEMRREGRLPEAAVAATLAVVGLAVTLAGVAFGIAVMLDG